MNLHFALNVAIVWTTCFSNTSVDDNRASEPDVSSNLSQKVVMGAGAASWEKLE